MTKYYTKEEAVELAREFDEDAFKWDGIGSDTLLATINAAVTRRLAEKELEVVRLRRATAEHAVKEFEIIELRRALDYIRSATDDAHVKGVVESTLSTPSSTKHLDEYVAEKVKEALDNGPYGEEVNDILSSKLAAAEDRVKELEKDAERYQWLVENATIMTRQWTHDGLAPCSTKQPLDNCIDAEIERSE